jgi:hypothetical protein
MAAVHVTTIDGRPVAPPPAGPQPAFGLRTEPVPPRSALESMSSNAPVPVIRTLYKDTYEVERMKENIPNGVRILPRRYAPQPPAAPVQTTTQTAPQRVVIHHEARTGAAAGNASSDNDGENVAPAPRAMTNDSAAVGPVRHFSGAGAGDAAGHEDDENWVSFEPELSFSYEFPPPELHHRLPNPSWNYHIELELEAAAKLWAMDESSRDPLDVMEEASDPNMVCEYIDEIFEHLGEAEVSLPSTTVRTQEACANTTAGPHAPCGELHDPPVGDQLAVSSQPHELAGRPAHPSQSAPGDAVSRGQHH